MSYVEHYPGVDKIFCIDTLKELSKIKISKSDDITIITVATDDLIDSYPLISQLNNSNVSFVNADDFREDKINEFTMIDKINDYVAALETIETPYVLLIDAADAVITKDLDNSFIETFLSFNTDILFNATPYRYPKYEFFDKEPAFCTKFLNAGVCFGKTQELLSFYQDVQKEAQNGESISEQHYVKTVRENVNNVDIDGDSILFKCHVKPFKTVEAQLNYVWKHSGKKLAIFSSTDIEYYSNLFEYFSEKEISVNENITIVLLKNSGPLIRQLDSNNINYITVEDCTKYSSIKAALENVNTDYAVVVDPTCTVFMNDLDNSIIDSLNASDKPVLFGALTSRDDVTNIEKEKADEHYVAKFINQFAIFGYTEYIKQILTNAANIFDNTNYSIIRDIWIEDNSIIGIDTSNILFCCCYYNDITLKVQYCEFHSPFKWIVKDAGWHLID